jgi:hypothetical protein
MLPVLAATAAAFIIGGAYYALFGARLDSVSDQMPPWKFAVEVLRCLALAAAVAFLAARADVSWLALALVLFAGFPLVLLTGAVIHEGMRSAVAAVHGGDWLLKLLAVTAIVSAWQ